MFRWCHKGRGTEVFFQCVWFPAIQTTSLGVRFANAKTMGFVMATIEPQKVRQWFKAWENWWVVSLDPSANAYNGPDREPRRVQKLFKARTGQYSRSCFWRMWIYDGRPEGLCLKLVRVSLAATTFPLCRRKLRSWCCNTELPQIRGFASNFTYS